MIFRFSTGCRFAFQNASKMRSPGIPKLEKVVSGISSFFGVVFGSTFDEKWPQKGTSKSIRNMSIRCFLADPLPGGAPGFMFDRLLIDFGSILGAFCHYVFNNRYTNETDVNTKMNRQLVLPRVGYLYVGLVPGLSPTCACGQGFNNCFI